MNKISQGVKVRVTADNGSEYMWVDIRILNNRQLGAEGTAMNRIPGACSELWFVQHEHGIAAYNVDELEPIIDHSHEWTMEEIVEREA